MPPRPRVSQCGCSVLCGIPQLKGSMSITPDTIRHLVAFCCVVGTFGDFLQIYLCMSEKSTTFAGAKLWRVLKIR